MISTLPAMPLNPRLKNRVAYLSSSCLYLMSSGLKQDQNNVLGFLLEETTPPTLTTVISISISGTSVTPVQVNYIMTLCVFSLSFILTFSPLGGRNDPISKAYFRHACFLLLLQIQLYLKLPSSFP